MSRVRTKGKANNRFKGFKEEISLAALLQNARSRRLGWTRGVSYRNSEGQSCDLLSAVVCCAVGAEAIKPAGIPLSVTIDANDYPGYEGYLISGKIQPEVQLGHAFRAAMTEGSKWR